MIVLVLEEWENKLLDESVRNGHRCALSRLWCVGVHEYLSSASVCRYLFNPPTHHACYLPPTPCPRQAADIPAPP